MAIKRYTAQIRTTSFNGTTVGVREPITGEMLEITRRRQEYLSTVTPENTEGDLSKFFVLQKYVSELLACDPEDDQNPWFAEDAEQQKSLSKNNVEKDLASEVPHRFHVKIWEVFAEPIVEGKDEKNAPLDPTEGEISSESTPSLSESQNTLDVTQAELSDGPGVDSLSA